MPGQRKMIGPLDTAGSVAIENARVCKELRRGRIEASLSLLSGFGRGDEEKDVPELITQISLFAGKQGISQHDQ